VFSLFFPTQPQEEIKMKWILFNFWKIFSWSSVLVMVLVITWSCFYSFFYPEGDFILYERNKWISLSEIILGINALVYLFYRLILLLKSLAKEGWEKFWRSTTPKD